MNTWFSRMMMITSVLSVAVLTTLASHAVGVQPTATDQHNSGDGFRAFVVCGASATSEELVAVRFDRVNGELVSEIVQREPLGFECAPVVFHQHHRLLYVASLGMKKVDANQLAIFSVGPDGRLTLKKTQPIAHGSAYLSFDRTGQFLLTASYFEGHVDVYRLKTNGTSPALVSTTFEDRDMAHSILISPSNRFAYVPYVKEQNAMFQYSFDKNSGTLQALDPPQAEVPDSVGPRHVAFHPTKPFVFFSSEQQLGATSWRIGEGGQLTLVEVCRPGELRPSPRVAASDIVITPDGRHLFIGVRDFAEGVVDAIHRYDVHDDGYLTHQGTVDADSIPWGLKISPDGHHLLVTAAHGETLTAFEIDDGGLTKRTSIKWGRMIRDMAVAVCE